MNNLISPINIKKSLIVVIICMFASSCSNRIINSDYAANDPFEKYNRKTHNFNKAIDRAALLPASQIYGNSVPQSLRLSAASFYSNIQEPKRFTNHLIQGQFSKASVDVSRFVINSSLGILGLFDAASWLNFFPEETDFDETFAYWSIPTGPYLEMPFLGPSSARGFIGFFADYTVNPLLMLPGPLPSVSFATFEIVNIINSRYEYGQAIDSLLYDSSDSYSSSRLTFLQKARNMAQSNENLTLELFDPLEEF